jgi:CRP-like cAMP-binding protein
MQVFATAREGVERLNWPRAEGGGGQSLLLTENVRSLGGAPSLFELLTAAERETVIRCGRRRVLYRGQTLFNQGSRHEGIFLIETGRIRVFYTAPSQREITLAYWHPGNFVGGPEVFGGGVHQWSGVATSNSSVVHLPGKELRKLVGEIPNLAIGLIEGLTFKGKCYSALAQMLGTRSITERLSHRALRRQGPRGHSDRRRFHPRRPRPHGRRDQAMGDHQLEAPAREERTCRPQVQDHRAAGRCPAGDAWAGQLMCLRRRRLLKKAAQELSSGLLRETNRRTASNENCPNIPAAERCATGKKPRVHH